MYAHEKTALMQSGENKKIYSRPHWLSWMCVGRDQEVAGSTPAGSAIFFHGDDHEIFSMVILIIPLIQEGQLSVSKECAQYWLTI